MLNSLVSSGCHLAQHRSTEFLSVHSFLFHSAALQFAHSKWERVSRTWTNTIQNIKWTFSLLTYRPLKCCSPKSLNRWAISLLSVGMGERKNHKTYLNIEDIKLQHAAFHPSLHSLKLFPEVPSLQSVQENRKTAIPFDYIQSFILSPKLLFLKTH